MTEPPWQSERKCSPIPVLFSMPLSWNVVAVVCATDEPFWVFTLSHCWSNLFIRTYIQLQDSWSESMRHSIPLIDNDSFFTVCSFLRSVTRERPLPPTTQKTR